MKFPNSGTLSNSTLKKQKKSYDEHLKFYSHKYSSKAQKEIENLVKEHYEKVLENDKTLLNGVEIDILIPEIKLGIEYNGNFYHSEFGGKKDRNFHLNKTILMNKKGYNLLHVFEDEWELKKEIVKSKIKHICKINNNLIKVHARKCEIKEIHPSIKNIFLNKNHIQGEDKANVCLGAYYNNILLSVMTFDNNRQMNQRNNEKTTYELKRFCIDINYSITGIASKLLKYFIKNYKPKKIISFADRRWTLNNKNNLYNNLKFKLTKILKPDYSYYNSKIDRCNRYHKFSFGKNSLKKKYPELYDDNKTELEMMRELGYDRIWDCGNLKYEWQNKV